MDEELRSELIRRQALDQEVRHAYFDGRPEEGWSDADKGRLMERWQEVDADNASWIRQVIDDHGWPGKSLVGTDGASAAWLLVQHAPLDLQEACLFLMEESVEAGEASKIEWAYLFDRVLVGKGEPQLFGTQFVMIDGKLAPHPIRDPDRVDQRRAELGLESLAEYEKKLTP